MNEVILIGRLVKDPELSATKEGKSVMSFPLAVRRETADGQADFPTVVAYDKTAEFISNYMKKGSRLAIKGKLRTRTYDDVEGKRHYVTEVVAKRVEFADGKPIDTEYDSAYSGR